MMMRGLMSTAIKIGTIVCVIVVMRNWKSRFSPADASMRMPTKKATIDMAKTPNMINTSFGTNMRKRTDQNLPSISWRLVASASFAGVPSSMVR